MSSFNSYYHSVDPATKKIHGENILNSSSDAIFITVNMVGVMGAGLAKAAANKWPHLLEVYRQHLRKGILKLGKVSVVPIDHRVVILIATKDHWKNPSKLEWIIQGLENFKERTVNGELWNISSVAIPPLGSGLGGLNWDRVVKPKVYSVLNNWDGTVNLYEPMDYDIPI